MKKSSRGTFIFTLLQISKKYKVRTDVGRSSYAVSLMRISKECIHLVKKWKTQNAIIDH